MPLPSTTTCACSAHKKTCWACAQQVFLSGNPAVKPGAVQLLGGFCCSLGSFVSGSLGSINSLVSSSLGGVSSFFYLVSSLAGSVSGLVGSFSSLLLHSRCSRCFHHSSWSFYSRSGRHGHGSLFLLAASDQSSRSNHGSQDERVFHVETSKGMRVGVDAATMAASTTASLQGTKSAMLASHTQRHS